MEKRLGDRLDHLGEFALADRADALVHYLAALEQQQRGDAATLYRAAIEECSSTLTLPTFSLPRCSSAKASTVGAIMRHGPHHSP